ncbi:SRPBCC family protein [Mesorhizobium marinum]|uniref:SRPBCC family protein n=1 Tax=Mesorhizobium marinum TaxID=3228790 RepID=A0ABV3R131_9HYPH
MLTLKRVLYAISAAAIVLVAGSFLLPAEAVVSRSIAIAAPPERVFAIVGDLRNFNAFSPSAQIDPDIRYAFEGTESGIGQKMVWQSDNVEVGTGAQTITLYEPPGRVEFRVISGRRDRSNTAFELAASDVGTDVTWTFRTSLKGIPARWSGLLFEGRVGPEYEAALARLKAIAERPEQGADPASPAP